MWTFSLQVTGHYPHCKQPSSTAHPTIPRAEPSRQEWSVFVTSIFGSVANTYWAVWFTFSIAIAKAIDRIELKWNFNIAIRVHFCTTNLWPITQIVQPKLESRKGAGHLPVNKMTQLLSARGDFNTSDEVRESLYRDRLAPNWTIIDWENVKWPYEYWFQLKFGVNDIKASGLVLIVQADGVMSM